MRYGIEDSDPVSKTSSGRGRKQKADERRRGRYPFDLFIWGVFGVIVKTQRSIGVLSRC